MASGSDQRTDDITQAAGAISETQPSSSGETYGATRKEFRKFVPLVSEQG